MNDAEKFINYLSVSDMSGGGTLLAVQEKAKEFGYYRMGSFSPLIEMDVNNLLILLNDQSSVFYICKTPGSDNMLQAAFSPFITLDLISAFMTDEGRAAAKKVVAEVGTKGFLDSVCSVNAARENSLADAS
jgi:hypothetical protein